MGNKSGVFRLGLFIVAALLILAVGVFLIGDKEFLFSSTYRLNADFQNVAGLNEGADVRVGGLREGTVKRIDLPTPPGRKVTVVMKMHNSTIGIIRKDSVAAIKTEGILGDKYVEISFGSKETTPVADGDVIHAEPIVDVSEVANSVAVQAKSALSAFQENMEALKQNFLLRDFYNRRGYEDSSDLTKHAITRLPTKPRRKEFDYQTSALFDKPDGIKLNNQKTLNEAGKYLAERGFSLAVVAAATGPVGDSDKSRELTRTQAMVIRDFLVQNFALDDTRIKTMGMGKSKASGDNSKIQILVY